MHDDSTTTEQTTETHTETKPAKPKRKRKTVAQIRQEEAEWWIKSKDAAIEMEAGKAYENAAWMIKHGAYARTAEDLQRVIDARHAEICRDAYTAALRDVGIPEFVVKAIAACECAEEAQTVLKMHLATVKHCAEQAGKKADEKPANDKNALTQIELDMVRRGEIIGAIREVRVRTHLGLVACKDLVDAARAEMNRGAGQ